MKISLQKTPALARIRGQTALPGSAKKQPPHGLVHKTSQELQSWFSRVRGGRAQSSRCVSATSLGCPGHSLQKCQMWKQARYDKHKPLGLLLKLLVRSSVQHPAPPGCWGASPTFPTAPGLLHGPVPHQNKHEDYALPSLAISMCNSLRTSA